MIALVNERFVPVWINIRREPLPKLSALRRVLIAGNVNPDGYVTDLVSQGFFLRSAVLTPDGQELLNPQLETVAGSFESLRRHGYFSYAQVGVEDYLRMLHDALDRAAALTACAP